LCSAGAHGGEGFMARSVEEDDFAARGIHGIGADVLRDATGFTLSDVRGTDSI
jgi:hypothetical protein